MAGRKTKAPIPIPPTCLDLPPGMVRGSVLWFDGERLTYSTPTGEGQVLTSTADNGLAWANPPGGLAVPKNGHKPGPVLSDPDRGGTGCDTLE